MTRKKLSDYATQYDRELEAHQANAEAIQTTLNQVAREVRGVIAQQLGTSLVQVRMTRPVGGRGTDVDNGVVGPDERLHAVLTVPLPNRQNVNLSALVEIYKVGPRAFNLECEGQTFTIEEPFRAEQIAGVMDVIQPAFDRSLERALQNARTK